MLFSRCQYSRVSCFSFIFVYTSANKAKRFLKTKDTKTAYKNVHAHGSQTRTITTKKKWLKLGKQRRRYFASDIFF